MKIPAVIIGLILIGIGMSGLFAAYPPLSTYGVGTCFFASGGVFQVTGGATNQQTVPAKLVYLYDAGQFYSDHSPQFVVGSTDNFNSNSGAPYAPCAQTNPDWVSDEQTILNYYLVNQPSGQYCPQIVLTAGTCNGINVDSSDGSATIVYSYQDKSLAISNYFIQNYNRMGINSGSYLNHNGNQKITQDFVTTYISAERAAQQQTTVTQNTTQGSSGSTTTPGNQTSTPQPQPQKYGSTISILGGIILLAGLFM